MSDVHLVGLAGRQHNRFSRAQAEALGLGDHAIQHRLDRGRIVAVEQGVFAFTPVGDDNRGRWMAATLTAPETVLSHASASAAHGFWIPRERVFETVTRPGNGGPCRHGGLLVFRSRTLAGETGTRGCIPITLVERTLVDLAAHVDDRALARAVREAVRLRLTTVGALMDAIERHRGRRGTRRLARICARYSRLPLERARSGAEVRALEVLRDAGVELPALNRKVAGEEADLVWLRHRRIVEIDGGPFHLDAGEDARKEQVWRRAGYLVDRLPSDDVYDHPERLIALAPRGERR